MKGTTLKLICDMCGVQATGCAGHVGKKHKKCGGRKPGALKTACGTWRAA